MKKINFNKNWEFTFDYSLDAFNGFGIMKYNDATGAASHYYDHSNWERIDLPHDWAVALPKDLSANTFAGARANSRFNWSMTERRSNIDKIYNLAWYRKQFPFDPAWEGKRVFIEFEGVFRDSKVWVNGVYIDGHMSGYTSFILEITDHLVREGDNSVAVRVDSDQNEGWWYEGAGIYRNVNILVAEPTYFKPNQTVIKTQLDGNISASAVLVNDSAHDFSTDTVWEILGKDGKCVASTTKKITVPAYSEKKIEIHLKVNAPILWHVDNPYLYSLNIRAGEETTAETFGIRTVGFDADRGFLLNGEPYKIHGACVHQDFGGVGVALTDNLIYYKIKRLKDMGVNAYRSAHHAPAPTLLKACDELGMLVMGESRMFGTSAEAIRQLTDVIERDRNHPCVFIWSIGNEEFNVQNDPWSARLTEKVTRIVKTLDDTRLTTYSGNNGSNFNGANRVSEVRGINYLHASSKDTTGYWVDEYHAAHPHQPIIGTEESSYVLSRGSAVTDLGSGLLDSTGNVTMPWGTTPKGWVKHFEERPFLAGSFMWTGFDYRGEPNPFITTNVCSSFGTIDLCGMEKPPFYYYKAWWTDEDVLKLTPHWNHNEGDKVTMAVFTNCKQITLYINGREIETKKVERFDAPLFEVEFEAGVISVEGTTKDGKVLCDELRTSSDTAEVRCVPVLDAKDEGDVAIYELQGFDKDGLFNPTAYEEIELTVENGRFVGVGNGDPSCLDYEQKPCEEEALFIRTFNYEKGMYSVPLKDENIQSLRYDFMEMQPTLEGFSEDFRAIAKYKYNLEDRREVAYTTKVIGVKGYQYIEFERLGTDATVYLNGVEIGNNLRNARTSYAYVRPYRFYCNFADGENEIKVLTVQRDNMARPISGYVKIGKRIDDTPWRVRLHYGLARVFVKSETPDKVKINAKLR